MGGADELRVPRKDASGVARLWRAPFRPSGFDFFGGQIEGELAFLGIDGDRIAIADDCDRPAYVGFGCDVPDNQSMAAAGESSVGNEGHVFAQTFARNR